MLVWLTGGSNSDRWRQLTDPTLKMGEAMKILSRCSDIIVANINALLDRAENPEAMIAQVIREMEDGLAEARGHAARAIAAERWLNRELMEQRVGIDYWQTKARAAVAANRDDLARLALARMRELEISSAEWQLNTRLLWKPSYKCAPHYVHWKPISTRPGANNVH